MKEKYRFIYENGKASVDEMLWVFDNFIIGITHKNTHFVMNHYGKDFDKSDFIKVEMEYDLDSYAMDYFQWVFDEMEHWYL